MTPQISHHARWLDWLFPLGDVEATSYPTFIRDVGVLAMGSVGTGFAELHYEVPRPA